MNSFSYTTYAITAALGLALVAGCSPSPSQQPAQPPPPPTENPSAKLPEPATPANPSAKLPEPATPKMPAGHPEIGLPPPTETAKIPTLAEIEGQYRAATSLHDKIKAMRQLVHVRDDGAVEAVGRLFHEEKDLELREEFLETLLDMRGKEADKLSVLASAVSAGQPADTRELAIDIMIDLGSKNAIPVLENLVNDPDATIRDAAKDAIREIQNPTPTMTSNADENDVDEK
jgi:hypothetical protein